MLALFTAVVSLASNGLGGGCAIIGRHGMPIIFGLGWHSWILALWVSHAMAQRWVFSWDRTWQSKCPSLPQWWHLASEDQQVVLQKGKQLDALPVCQLLQCCLLISTCIVHTQEEFPKPSLIIVHNLLFATLMGTFFQPPMIPSMLRKPNIWKHCMWSCVS